MSENPPAFPGDWAIDGHEPQYGMTLRDWFAGQALAGRNVSRQYRTWEDMAADAYEIADAMLAARSKP